jgi:hypothetical protein
MSKDLKQLLQKNFDTIFNDMELFIFCIPDLAKVVGLKEFMKKMKLTTSQYYRRIEDPDKWNITELKKAKEIFKEYNLGTS